MLQWSDQWAITVKITKRAAQTHTRLSRNKARCRTCTTTRHLGPTIENVREGRSCNKLQHLAVKKRKAPKELYGLWQQETYGRPEEKATTAPDRANTR